MRSTSSTAPADGVDVRAPQLGREQVPAAEHVERQVAVAVVVAMEEPALLMAVQRIVGGIEIEDDLRRRLARGHRGTDRRTAPRSPRRRGRSCGSASAPRRLMLQPVQRALAGQRRAVATAAPPACRPAPPSPGRGAAGRGRSGPRSPARCRTPADRPGRDLVLDPVRRSRRSAKQAANRSISPIARSVAPSSSAPASEVIAPPSNAATTAAPFDRCKIEHAARYTLSASGSSSAQ